MRDMRLFVAGCPPYRGIPAGITPVRAAYRLDENGALCALPQSQDAFGGLLLVTGWSGTAGTACIPAILRECHRRRFCGVAIPFSAPALVKALWPPLRQAGLSLWVSELDGHLVSESRVLVNTALSGGDLRTRLMSACRAFTAERIVLDVQRLRMVFPLPCPTGEGVPLTASALRQLRQGRPVFYSRELGARYCTCRQNGRTVFVLFDDAETLCSKLSLGEALGIPRGLLTLPESDDVLANVVSEWQKNRSLRHAQAPERDQ